ncbi:MAG: Radical core protein [Pseudomonadota bacterium]|nr:Radical core protein [Pseudomonadota bacterium]
MVSTDADFIFFMSSSGHCSLDCTYCIINPIVKHQLSLTIADINYLLDTVGGKSALLFSGKGDFFTGYRKGENLLSNLLERNVDVALDINGVIIQEFPSLPDHKVEKIKHINLTMHYTQILNKNALSIWKENAKTLIKRQKWESFLMNTIMSPAEEDFWEEALSFYEENIFKETGQSIVLIRDTLNWEPSFEAKLDSLRNQFSYLVSETREVNFAKMFEDGSDVLCPAGKEYFRVWNDGKIEGCPYISELTDCGNAKIRTFSPRKSLFRCNQPRYCDCSHIKRLGKMRDSNSRLMESM